MATSPEEFTRATAHSTRLRILMLLADQSERCVCDITAALELPQPKISRHLAILRETGILVDRRAGQWIHYRVDPDIHAWAMDAINAIARGCIGKAPFEDDRQRLAQGTEHQLVTCV
ncbi:MAG: metalloregulator ArsR/SmtB family transcription factor [Chromatiaceae bacterium]|nr:metalloregulator ArsR/SmtB family transcription factor [Chromatiaceae bacterium]